MFIREASLCFEYLKTYLLPPLGDKNPVGLIKKNMEQKNKGGRPTKTLSEKRIHCIDILPYHTLGVFKYEELGIDYQLKGIEPPTAERVENARRIMESVPLVK